MSDKNGGGFFQRRSFCIVTGASRGLGKEIAIQLSREWDKEGTSNSNLRDSCILAHKMSAIVLRSAKRLSVGGEK